MPSVINFFTKKKQTAPKNDSEKADQVAIFYLCATVRNEYYHSRMGELALIFLDKNSYVFVEVRFRANVSHSIAVEGFNPSTLRKVRLMQNIGYSNIIHQTSLVVLMLYCLLKK